MADKGTPLHDMRRGVLHALAAAALFGASTPLAKVILGDVHPIVLAGLFYAGSGIGLAVLQVLRLAFGQRIERVVWPTRFDWSWLTAAILVGGILAPVLLMFGLAATAASTASLLLNLEAAFTALLAWFLFRENFDRRIALGMAAILGGGIVLSLGPGSGDGISRGALLVAGACLCWAIDNNLTRKVSTSDAIVIAGLKGLVAGGVNLSLALSLGYALPSLATIAQVASIGFLGYGLSLVLFVLALRHLGTARTGAYFAVAPFFGGVLAVLFLDDPLTVRLCIAAVFMAVGVWLHLSEHHEHEHIHDAALHTHPHRHDAHHQHAHDFEWDGSEPHTHSHRHEAIVHRHVHFPDVHHRHRHG
jgi:drug/metabolite transporter (DMT)-like permease